MSHYFSEKQEVKSDRKIIRYEIENRNFEFITDNGIFSKAKVDFGTDVMLTVFLRETSNRKNQKTTDTFYLPYHNTVFIPFCQLFLFHNFHSLIMFYLTTLKFL